MTEEFVINPQYFPFINDRLSDADEKNLYEIKREILEELSEGAYPENEEFIEKMDFVFSQTGLFDYKESVLYGVIKDCLEMRT